MCAWYKEDQSAVTSMSGAYFEVYLLFLELKTPNYFIFFSMWRGRKGNVVLHSENGASVELNVGADFQPKSLSVFFIQAYHNKAEPEPAGLLALAQHCENGEQPS